VLGDRPCVGPGGLDHDLTSGTPSRMTLPSVCRPEPNVPSTPAPLGDRCTPSATSRAWRRWPKDAVSGMAREADAGAWAEPLANAT